MVNEQEKTTVPIPSVGADGEQPLSNDTCIITADDNEINYPDDNSDINFEELQRRLSDPSYLHAINMTELFNTVYTEAFLSGGEVTVAYNPDDVTEVWLLDKGLYIPFALIESRFNGKSLDSVHTMQQTKKQTITDATADNLQAQIDLAEHIQVIAAKGKQTNVGINNIRNTRKREQARTHIDFVKEGNIRE